MAPTSSGEDYLRAIQALEQRDGIATTSALSREVGVTRPSATKMVQRLARDGLVAYEPYQGATLTRQGRAAATRVTRRHRLLELFLVEVLGMGWETVHAEADRLEHHLSEQMEARISEHLGHPNRDPHGDPIPTPEGVQVAASGDPLHQAPDGVALRLVRVTDQSPDALALVEALGLTPGARLTLVRCEPVAGVLTLDVGGDAVHLSLGVARDLRVEALEA